MARGPSFKIPSVAGAIKGADAVDFVRRVGAEPRDVDVTFAAATTATARHGLARRYVGADIIGVSVGHASGIDALTPEAAEAAGYDPATYIAVTTGTAYTGTVRVRVF